MKGEWIVENGIALRKTCISAVGGLDGFGELRFRAKRTLPFGQSIGELVGSFARSMGHDSEEVRSELYGISMTDSRLQLRGEEIYEYSVNGIAQLHAVAEAYSALQDVYDSEQTTRPRGVVRIPFELFHLLRKKPEESRVEEFLEEVLQRVKLMKYCIR